MACNCRKKKDNPGAQYPGVAEDKGLNDQVTPAEVKQETKDLNNNPRDNPA